MTDGKKIMESALCFYGGKAQVVVAMEELSELSKELAKSYRGSGDMNHIAEEIADVQIMLAQMIMYYDIEKDVRLWKEQKLGRLRSRLDELGK